VEQRSRARWLGRETPESDSSTLNGVPADPHSGHTPRPLPLGTGTSTATAAGRLHRHYELLSATWKVEEDLNYSRLVVPTGNADLPIHRWFHLKEAYSHRLLAKVLAEVKHERAAPLAVLDPFNGIGTTILSALDLGRAKEVGRVVGRGLEVNPLLHAVSSAKLAAAQHPSEDILESLADVVSLAKSRNISRDEWPLLTTFAREEFFPSAHVDSLVAIRKAIDEAELPGDVEQLAKVALAMTVEPASRLRRDGRALRLDSREPVPPIAVFERALKRIAIDLDQIRSAPIEGADVSVKLASAAQKQWQLGVGEAFDIAVFSPPYPNNIDYTEVYKTELWALGFVATPEEFRQQRHETLRSHPSVKFTRPIVFHDDSRRTTVDELLAPILAAIPEKSRYAKQLERMIVGYADDMLLTLDGTFGALKAGGHCVYVVGNSVHGSTSEPLVIASDVILGRLAELAGFEVTKLKVARWLPRRKVESAFVRESVVFLTKPDSAPTAPS